MRIRLVSTLGAALVFLPQFASAQRPLPPPHVPNALIARPGCIGDPMPGSAHDPHWQALHPKLARAYGCHAAQGQQALYAAPLMVVDGVIIGHEQPSGGVPGLNPDEIASITVLTGPEAVERFGADAKAGAIVITTQR